MFQIVGQVIVIMMVYCCNMSELRMYIMLAFHCIENPLIYTTISGQSSLSVSTMNEFVIILGE